MIWKRKTPTQEHKDMPNNTAATDTGTPERPSFEQYLQETCFPRENADEGHRAQTLPFERPKNALRGPLEDEEGEDGPEASSHAYGLYRGSRGGPGVEIFLSDGTAHALPYPQIMEAVTNPQATLLVIHCNAGHLFAVHGRHLAPLRTALMLGRVRFLKSPAQGPDGTAIERITVEHPRPEE